MQNSKKNKLILSVASVALAASLLIGGGTLAYLRAESTPVVNEFKANKVEVDLTETGDGQYNIIPGTSEEKDPTVTVDNSVDAYVYVEVTDKTDGLVQWEPADGWSKLTGFANTVYYRSVDASEEAQVFSIIKDDTVYYDAALENSDMLVDGQLKEGLELTFKAYAVQKYEGVYSNGSYDSFSSTDAYLAVLSDAQVEVTTNSKGISVLKSGKDVVLGADMQTLKLIRTNSNGQNVSVDLNGYTLSPTQKDLYAVGVENDDAAKPTTITVIGEGTVTGDTGGDINHAAYADGAGAYVVLESGTYVNTASSGEMIYAENGGHIIINGGTFKNEGAPKWTLNLKDNSGSSIVVTGGSFWEYDPSNSDTEPGGPVSFVAEGYTVVPEVKEDGTWYTVVPATA